MILDTLTKRYPNRRPSSYLGIVDEWTAFQLDSALAQAGENRDREFIISLVESINDHLINVMRSTGAKVKTKPNRNQPKEKLEGRPLAEVLQMIGGAGTVVNIKPKDGK